MVHICNIVSGHLDAQKEHFTPIKRTFGSMKTNIPYIKTDIKSSFKNHN